MAGVVSPGSSTDYGGHTVFPSNSTEHNVYDSYGEQSRSSAASQSFDDLFESKNPSGSKAVKSSPYDSGSPWDRDRADPHHSASDTGWNKFTQDFGGVDSDDSSVDMDLMDKFDTERSELDQKSPSQWNQVHPTLPEPPKKKFPKDYSDTELSDNDLTERNLELTDRTDEPLSENYREDSYMDNKYQRSNPSTEKLNQVDDKYRKSNQSAEHFTEYKHEVDNGYHKSNSPAEILDAYDEDDDEDVNIYTRNSTKGFDKEFSDPINRKSMDRSEVSSGFENLITQRSDSEVTLDDFKPSANNFDSNINSQGSHPTKSHVTASFEDLITQRSDSDISVEDIVTPNANSKSQTRFSQYRDNVLKSSESADVLSKSGLAAARFGDLEGGDEHGSAGPSGVMDDYMNNEAGDLDTDRTTGSLDTEVLLKDFDDKVLVNSKYRNTPNITSSSAQRFNNTYTKSTSTKKSSTKPVSLYNSTDKSQKYTSYQTNKGAFKSPNALKHDFVNEMLNRAQQKNASDNYYQNYGDGNSDDIVAASQDSVKSSSDYKNSYPRGVTLSKTFTKSSNYRSGSLKWNNGNSGMGSKYSELTYGPGNIFTGTKSGGHTNLTKYSHTDVTAKGWTAHNDGRQTSQDEEGLVSPTTPTNGAMSPGVIDENYYKSVITSTKISRPSESSGEIDIGLDSPVESPAPRNTHPTTKYSKSKRDNKNSGGGTVKLTSTTKKASVSRPSSVASNASRFEFDLNRPDSAMSMLSVEGVKQDTGPKRPKSSAAVGKYRTNHQPSFVDETLFGNGPVEPSFEAPWGEPDKLGKKPLPFVAMTSMEPHLDRRTLPPTATASRPTSAKHRPVSASTKKRLNKELSNFQQPYVDEMLFGGRDVHNNPSFKAPWDKGSGPKPHAFDGTDSRPGSGQGQRVRKGGGEGEVKKPVWK